MLLLVPTARRAPWGPLAGCAVGAMAVTWLVASRDTATTGQVLTALRWSAVLLAAGAASVLDAPTEDDLAGAGLPVWHRRLLALLVVGIPTVATWATALAIPDPPLPWAAVSLEAAALVLLGLAVASTRRARAASVPAGVVAVALPTVLLIAGAMLPARWQLLAHPADVNAWRDAHGRWAWLAVGATVAIAIAARDPARRAAWRMIHPARPSTRPNHPPAHRSSDTLVEHS